MEAPKGNTRTDAPTVRGVHATYSQGRGCGGKDKILTRFLIKQSRMQAMQAMQAMQDASVVGWREGGLEDETRGCCESILRLAPATPPHARSCVT